MNNWIESRISTLASVVGFFVLLASVVGFFIVRRNDAAADSAEHRRNPWQSDRTDRSISHEVSKAFINTRPTRIREPQAIGSTKSDLADPKPLSPNSLSPNQVNPPDLMAEIQVRGDGNASHSRTITRTSERVHVRHASPHAKIEWLFVRNPIDPDRVAGFKTDHQHRVVLEYDDSALRSEGIAFNWAHVTNFGIDPAEIQRLKPSPEQRSFSNISFRQYLREDPKKTRHGSSISELWWHEELALALQWVVQNNRGGIRSDLIAIKQGQAIDRSLIADPQERFPDYTVIDAIDWLEQIHEHTQH